jgi:hypothetical protein
MPNNFTIVITPTPLPTFPAAAIKLQRTTAYDIVQSLRDYAGAQASGETDREARRALLDGYREFYTAAHWTYLTRWQRVQLHGQFTQGTVTYASSGNLLTLTGAVWPQWAGQASMRIGSGTQVITGSTSGVVAFQSVARISDTQLQLDPFLCPQGDVLTPQPFILYADQYEMPDDFTASDQWYADVAWGAMSYVHPNQWLQVTRYYFSFSNTPRYYSFIQSRWTPGRLALVIFPFPNQDRTLDSLYRKKPRAITIWDASAGSISGAIGQNTVSGNGTGWTNAMVGSVLRVSGDNQNFPTNFEGENAFAEEHIVTQVSSPTLLNIDTALAGTYNGVKHRVSDLVDFEEGAMMNAFRCCCEKRFARQRSMKQYPQAVQAYKEALFLAREADVRTTEQRAAGQGGSYRTRMAYMPVGADVP